MRKLLFDGLIRAPLTEPPPPPEEVALRELATSLERAARKRLGRSLAIRQVDAGSCNGCELEIHALNNAFYDLERFGLRFVASPRHADVLLVWDFTSHAVRRAWPFDVIPRAITSREWARTEAGLKQRVQALNHFIQDIYGEQKIVRDKIFPASLRTMGGLVPVYFGDAVVTSLLGRMYRLLWQRA